ncbi:hypothetical protein ACMXYN_09685 [Neptuniibacter sp. PT8_73]|uniref:hypothetical protein n=1 Tax=Neptuniibacter sp. PT8_73 TaxID=3398206 RepID=UPI0039F4496F
MTPVREIQFEDLSSLRDQSKKVSSLLSEDLHGYVKTLTTLCAPRKVLGEYMQSASRDKVIGAEKNFSLLEERYKSVMRDAFGLSAKLSTPLSAIHNKLSLTPWSYSQELSGLSSPLLFSTPVRWVLGYDCSYDLVGLISDRIGGQEMRYEEVSPFVIRALTIWLLIEQSPDLQRILSGLGYEVSIETLPDVSGDLPYVVLTSVVPAFRPQDSLVSMVSQLSGGSTFEELVDIDGLEGMAFDLKDRLLGVLA